MNAPTPQTIIELSGVTHTYPDGRVRKVVLDSVDFSLRKGELVAVMGRSGSGKSTLLNIVAGLLQPDSGRVILGQTLLGKCSRRELASLRRSQYGIVFQRNNLIEALSIVENVALPLELNGTKPHIARAQAQLVLADQGLEEIADLHPSEASGGQRQLAAVLAALSSRREILLADEPTGALDSAAGDEVMRLIRSHIDAGASGLFVTHDARDAAWADRIIYIQDGLVSSDTGYSAFPTMIIDGRER